MFRLVSCGVGFRGRHAWGNNLVAGQPESTSLLEKDERLHHRSLVELGLALQSHLDLSADLQLKVLCSRFLSHSKAFLGPLKVADEIRERLSFPKQFMRVIVYLLITPDIVPLVELVYRCDR